MPPGAIKTKRNKPMNLISVPAAETQNPLPYQCIIFDLDGTLLDTRGGMMNALVHLLDELDHPLPAREHLAEALHFGLPAMLARALDGSRWWSDAAHRAALETRLTQTYLQGSAETVRVFQQARPLLERLADQGVWMAICTNQAERSARHLLQAFGLDRYFRAIVGGDTLGCRKPDPTPLLWLMNRAGVSPAQALMIGDSEVDVCCAQRAGIDVIVMQHGYGHFAEDAAIRRMTDFTALQGYLFGTASG
jgi:phosphoglycolate phosphatase